MFLLNHILVCISGIFFVLSSEMKQDDTIIYRHPEYPISICGTSGWVCSYDSAETKIFEMINNNHNMYIAMWYCNTDRRPKSYLKKVANSSGCIYTSGPEDTLLNELKASYITGSIVEEKVAYRIYLAAIRQDRGNYVLEIKCPEDCYKLHEDRVKDLLATLRIGN